MEGSLSSVSVFSVLGPLRGAMALTFCMGLESLGTP